MPHNIEGYAAICAKAEELGWPEAFKDDLKVHDARVMMDLDAPQEFGWGIRECGTDIFLPGDRAYLDLAYACKKYKTDRYYYWWADDVLREVTIDDIIAKLLTREKTDE
jgi:hypothetical protein